MKTWYRAVCDKHKEACHILCQIPHAPVIIYQNTIKIFKRG